MSRRSRRGRPVNGILLLDKPAGMTSNGALQQAKRLFGAAKAGHTGSLDPLATGVLPLCFGEATKFSQYLLDADKQYETTARLGVKTATGDADGDVVETREVPELDEEHVEDVISGFRGKISQVPSMYSAIKVDGEPLYKLARQGIEIERKSREVTIHKLELLSLDGDNVNLRIACSKGTYVRTLVEDIGEELGCGAHVTALRRTKSGPFEIANAITMDELEALGTNEEKDALLEPESAAVCQWPAIELTELTASYLKQGQAVQVANAPTAGWVRIFSEPSNANDFLGVGEVLEDGRIAPRRLVVPRS